MHLHDLAATDCQPLAYSTALRRQQTTIGTLPAPPPPESANTYARSPNNALVNSRDRHRTGLMAVPFVLFFPTLISAGFSRGEAHPKRLGLSEGRRLPSPGAPRTKRHALSLRAHQTTRALTSCVWVRACVCAGATGRRCTSTTGSTALSSARSDQRLRLCAPLATCPRCVRRRLHLRQRFS